MMLALRRLIFRLHTALPRRYWAWRVRHTTFEEA
jgi:hypothetical protein